MRWKERQSKIEDVVYETIDDLAEELEVKIPFYPEVYWIGKKISFEDLKLSKKYLDGFNDSKCGSSMNLPSKRMILIGEADTIHTSEEAGHFLHLVNSGIKTERIDLYTKDILDKISLRIIIEMFGFFCSKLIVPKRENEYSYNTYKDWLPKNIIGLNEIKEEFKKIECHGKREEYYLDFFTHQQGYGLGEKLFDYYISGIIRKKKLKKLFMDNFENGDPFLKFMELKYNILV